MKKINPRRLILGGLFAGLVFDTLEFGLGPLVGGRQFMAELQALGRPMQPSPGGLLFFVSIGFVLGMVSIWLYAAIRPRYGPGPMTAVRAAIAIWILHGWLHHMINAFVGVFSFDLMMKLAAMQLPYQILSTLLGAWIYREEV